jgi:E-phenylitaconyl-CoA hydratase
MPVTVQRIGDHVGVVLLDRPERLNSLDRAMRDELQRAWAVLSADPNVRVVVVTGAGDRAFCTGSDLSANPAVTEAFAVEAFGAGGDDGLLKGLDPDLPLIAAVNGLAIGGGFEIALGCDIRIASPGAEFGLTETRVGSMPGAGGTQLLPRTVGRSLAMQMLLTGERIDAPRALAAGLISEIADSVLDRSLEIANAIARNAPLAVRAVKRMVRLGEDAPLSTALQIERLAFGLIKATDDRREGRTAFTEKRTPDYTGA